MYALEKKQKLSPRVKVVWAFDYILFALAMAVVAYILVSVLQDTFNIDAFDLYTSFLIILLILIIPYLIYLQIRYNHTSYTIGSTNITIERGVINKRRFVVPFSKIQNINVEYTMLLRLLGIGRVVIETAGANVQESEMVLEGIEDAEEFVAHLIKDVREVKETEQKEQVQKTRIDVLTEELAKLAERVELLEKRFEVLSKPKTIKKVSKKKKSTKKR